MTSTVMPLETLSRNLLSAKTGIFLSAVLFVGLIFLVAYQVYQSQPAQIIVDREGLSSAEYQALSEAVSDQQVTSFFTAPLPQLQNKVMQQDWISQANIERQWERGIVVTVLPRQAIARFGSDYLIDVEGTVFKPVNDAKLDVSHLIMLQGDNTQSHLIMQQMHQVNQWFAPLDLTVEDLILTPRMTWVIRFNNGLRIIVDNELTSQKLMNASQLLQNQLDDKRSEIASLDLRYKNGLVIAWKNERPAPIEIAPVTEFLSDSLESTT